MEDSLALVYISYLLEDNNILLIEVWDRVLYARTEKGRNTFISKKGLEFNEQCYYRDEDYKRIIRKYHPDKVEGYCKSKKSSNKRKALQTAEEITKLTNNSRETMGVYRRILTAVEPIKHLQQFREYLQVFATKAGDKLREALRKSCEGRFWECFEASPYADLYIQKSHMHETLKETMEDLTETISRIARENPPIGGPFPI